MKLIERAWESYARMVVPKGADELQIKETRQAFYSGASILFSIMTGVHFFDGEPGDDDIEPTDTDMQLMSDIQAEIDAFGAELDLAILGIRRH